MFARKFILCGGTLCFFPCLGRNTIFLPLNSPTVNESEVLPYGVSKSTVWLFEIISVSYIPVPPIIAISAFISLIPQY